MELGHSLKGAIGETKVARGSLLSLPPSRYTRFNDVTLRLLDGTTQIDHVFVSRFGVFVIETKNWSGWIYGQALDTHWAQVFPTRKVRARNPLRQNRLHVKAVEAVLSGLSLPTGSVRSVVAFVGNARLKSVLPRNVTVGDGWARYIASFRRRILSDDQVREICRAISANRLPPSFQTDTDHVSRLLENRRPARRRTDLAASRPPRPAAVRDLASPYRSRMTGVVRDSF